MALEVMGERWSFMILRASFNGLHHFEEFLSELGIARNILSNRLGRLVEHGILGRQPMAEDRRKIEYRLTDKGSCRRRDAFSALKTLRWSRGRMSASAPMARRRSRSLRYRVATRRSPTA